MVTTAWPGPSGVGIAYHPFLHNIILERPDAFAFVEVPLDSYLDEARRGLLDPDLARLKAVASVHPIVWSGHSFGLGSERAAYTPSTEAAIGRLTTATDAVALHETPDWLNRPDPATEGPNAADRTPASLLGPQAEALRTRLPCRLTLDLRVDALGSAESGTVTDILSALAGTRCDLLLSLGSVMPEAIDSAARIGQALPGRVTGLALTPDAATAWASIADLLGTTGARSVVIRRERLLYPINALFVAAAQARHALAAAASLAPFAASGSQTPTQRDAQPVHGVSVRQDRKRTAAEDEIGRVARAAWRERLADMHRAQQLTRWAMRPAAAWEV